MITLEEFENLGNSLESYHAIFYTLFQFSNITFDKTIPTACIRVTGKGEPVQFCFNPDFWNQCTDYDRIFIICHECLHIIFKHGLRIKGLNLEYANIAADVVVNHYLVDRFNFDRNKITDWHKLCWVDTVFKNKSISTESTFEYYYNLLAFSNSASVNGLSLADDHSGFGGGAEEEESKGDIEDGKADIDEQIDDLIEKAGSLLSESEKEDIQGIVDKEGKDVKGGLQAGTGYIDSVWNMPKKLVQPAKAWAKIVKKWKVKNKHVFQESEQWARMNRRTALLDKSLILPSDMEFEGENDNRIDAWLYLDVSGSCKQYKDYFWKAASSIPKKYFKLRMFSFSTKVWEVDMKNKKIFGGGGTAFSCIDWHINDSVYYGAKYPNIVMVITDGYGNKINPKFPDRWHWFLTPNNSKGCIPKNSTIYNLKDFAKE